MEEMLNKTSDITMLFDKLIELVDHGSRTIFGNKVSVPETELLDLLEELKLAIPQEVDRANKILQDSEGYICRAKEEASQIIEKANAEASEIVENAKIEKENILRHDDLVQEAEEIAKELRKNAEDIASQAKVEADAYSAQTRKDALKYADQVLGYLESTLQDATTNIGNNRGSVADELSKQGE